MRMNLQPPVRVTGSPGLWPYVSARTSLQCRFKNSKSSESVTVAAAQGLCFKARDPAHWQRHY